MLLIFPKWRNSPGQFAATSAAKSHGGVGMSSESPPGRPVPPLCSRRTYRSRGTFTHWHSRPGLRSPCSQLLQEGGRRTTESFELPRILIHCIFVNVEMDKTWKLTFYIFVCVKCDACKHSHLVPKILFLSATPSGNRSADVHGCIRRQLL